MSKQVVTKPFNLISVPAAMDMGNYERFLDVYTIKLHEAVQHRPADYPWYPSRTVESVVANMAAAFIRGSYNKAGIAIAGTCKQLGIKHTYAAINRFLFGEK